MIAHVYGSKLLSTLKNFSKKSFCITLLKDNEKVGAAGFEPTRTNFQSWDADQATLRSFPTMLLEGFEPSPKG